MSSLPIGWDNRNNQMSEKDMKLGGDAANKFSSKGAYDHDGSTGYKTTEEVRSFYMQQIDQKQQQANETSVMSSSSSNLPIGWEDRQKDRRVQAKQFGAFKNKSSEPLESQAAAISLAQSTTAANSAEAALVRVATTTLDAMAQTLEQNPVALSPEERAAFATAMQRAMTAIAKCR